MSEIPRWGCQICTHGCIMFETSPLPTWKLKKKAEVVCLKGTWNLTQPKGHEIKVSTLFFYHICNPQEFKLVRHWLRKEFRSLQNVPELFRTKKNGSCTLQNRKTQRPPIGVKTSPRRPSRTNSRCFLFWMVLGGSFAHLEGKEFTLTCCSPRCHIRAKVIEHKLQRSLPLP